MLHSPINTVYLKLQCPAVQPPLVVVSNHSHNVLDFQQVAVGEFVLPEGSPKRCLHFHCVIFVSSASRRESDQEVYSPEHLQGLLGRILTLEILLLVQGRTHGRIGTSTGQRPDRHFKKICIRSPKMLFSHTSQCHMVQLSVVHLNSKL